MKIWLLKCYNVKPNSYFLKALFGDAHKLANAGHLERYLGLEMAHWRWVGCACMAREMDPGSNHF